MRITPLRGFGIGTGIVVFALSAAAVALWPAPDLSEMLGGRKANRLLSSDPDLKTPFRFAFYSDPQASTGIHETICQAIVDAKPEWVICGGDMVDDSESDRQWATYLECSKKLRDAVPYLPVRGNHDIDGPRFFDIFDLPGGKTWYACDMGPVHLVITDTETDMDPASEQGKWLAADLEKASERPFTIVCHHKPVYASGNCFATGDRAELKFFNPLFLEHGVDLAICGHEHFYERLEADGLTYIVADGAGRRLRDRSLDHPASKVFLKKNHYLIFTVFDDRIEGVACDLDGRKIDSFTVKPR